MKNTLEFIRKILEINTTIFLGLSGGSDSMCLFNILLKFKEEYNLKIVCAHVNHNVRKESKEEEEFVKKIVLKNNCLFETTKLNLNHKNFEANARKERYAFFHEMVKKYQAKYLMTAHHGDDLVETILMHMTRGSHFYGYCGFKKITHFDNFSLVRPLIYLTKDDILNYCKENKISYCLDKTNESDVHTRNRYRKVILPFLKKENKNVHLKYLQFSEEIEAIEDYLQKKTLDALTKIRSFDKVNLHELNKLEPLIKKRVLEYILKEEYQNDIVLITNKHIKAIIALCTSNKANTSIDLPLQKKAIKEYNLLYFSNKKNPKREEYILEDEIILNEHEKIIKVKDSDILKSNYLIRLNSQEISLPLKVRFKKDQDRMAVKNLKGHKKLKDIFIDEKVPLSKRNQYPIVVDSKNTILWLPGLKKSKFDKNKDEFYDIIYKYVIDKEDYNEK